MSERLTEGERHLWVQVLLQAALDARREYWARYSSIDGRSALDWFVAGGRDFREVCELAGFDPVYVRERTLKALGGRDAMLLTSRSIKGKKRDGLRGKFL